MRNASRAVLLHVVPGQVARRGSISRSFWDFKVLIVFWAVAFIPVAVNLRPVQGSNMKDLQAQAWETIDARESYRCPCCASLVARMRQAAKSGGPEAAMRILHEDQGTICASVEWMRQVGWKMNDPGTQAVS